MFSKPCCGWTDITIKDITNEFNAPASYLTDVPNDCLDAFIYALENCCSVVIDFDAEGWDYKLVCSKYDTYVIEEKDEYKLYHFDINLEDLIKEFLEDLERNYDEWISWMCYCEDDEVDSYNLKINKIKGLLRANC